MKDLLLNVGSGGGAAAAPSGGAAGAPTADAPVEEEKKEEKAEGKASKPSDQRMYTNNSISYRKGGIGRGYGLWAFRLNFLVRGRFCSGNQHVVHTNLFHQTSHGFSQESLF